MSHPVYTANCSIESLAYGGNDAAIPRYGHVKLNGDVAWQSAFFNGSFPDNRGVSVISVNPSNCSLQRPYQRFDTHTEPTAATQLSDYLQQIEYGSVMVVISADEPTKYLSDAYSTLNGLGADVSDVQWRGAFAFVAQKAFPAKTALRKTRTQEESENTPPDFIVTVTGS